MAETAKKTTIEKTQSNKKKKAKSKVGPKGKYHKWISEEGLTLIQGWARDGLTNEQIIKNIGVNSDTFYTWLKRFPEITERLKKGREVVDYEVENALLKRALGFKEKVQKPIKIRIDQWTEKVEYVDEEIYYPPDTTAQIFWLINRTRGKWQNTQSKNISLVPETNAILKSIAKQIQNNKDVDLETEIDKLEE